MIQCSLHSPRRASSARRGSWPSLSVALRDCRTAASNSASGAVRLVSDSSPSSASFQESRSERTLSSDILRTLAPPRSGRLLRKPRANLSRRDRSETARCANPRPSRPRERGRATLVGLSSRLRLDGGRRSSRSTSLQQTCKSLGHGSEVTDQTLVVGSGDVIWKRVMHWGHQTLTAATRASPRKDQPFASHCRHRADVAHHSGDEVVNHVDPLVRPSCILDQLVDVTPAFTARHDPATDRHGSAAQYEEIFRREPGSSRSDRRLLCTTGSAP